MVKPPHQPAVHNRTEKSETTVEARPEKAQGKEQGYGGHFEFYTKSMDTTPIEVPAEFQPNPPNIDRGNIDSLDPPRASSTPERVANSKVKRLREKAKLRRKMHKMKSEMESKKKKVLKNLEAGQE